MAGVKDYEIASILRNWLYIKHLSQLKAAKMLNVNPSVLSRQLQGKESIPYERINKMIELFSPCPEETERINSLLEPHKKIDNVESLLKENYILRLIGNHAYDHWLAALIEIWPEKTEDKARLLDLANEMFLQRQAKK